MASSKNDILRAHQKKNQKKRIEKLKEKRELLKKSLSEKRSLIKEKENYPTGPS